MRVLMLGWEFPPFHNGGLGTACYGLVKGLSQKGAHVTIVLPGNFDYSGIDFAKIISLGDVKIRRIPSFLKPYIVSEKSVKEKRNYFFTDLFDEVKRYTQEIVKIAQEEHFDIIHAHDWMTYGAGIAVKQASGKPLVVHVHATEFDRTGGHGVNRHVYDIERRGMHEADAIISVSKFTKDKIAAHYGINPDKVYVVHNAVESVPVRERERISDRNIVLFLGRMTLQKGPDYFLYAAKRVLELEPDTLFIMVGTGDMETKMIEKAAELKIADKVLFAGWMRGDDVYRAYSLADVYVMPSVSEPFGITPLEAMISKVPSIISRQSGVSEIINHCLKVDFWDVDDIAGKIIALLRYRELHNCLDENGLEEAKRVTWDIPAEKCLAVYRRFIDG